MNAQQPPSWTWAEIENAILDIPLERYTAVGRIGLTDDTGCKAARSMMSDDVRRALIQQRENK